MRSTLAMLIAVGSFGCGSSPGADAGSPDANTPRDSGPMLVDAQIDAGVDAQMQLPDAGSDSGVPTECIRGTCVPTCGSDLSMLDAALGSGYSVLAHICRNSRARSIVLGDGGPFLYDVTASGDDTSTTVVISRGVIMNDFSVAMAPIQTDTLAVGMLDSATFLGSFLRITSDRARATYGYTQLGDTVPGQIVIDVFSPTATASTNAPGNYDATWLSDTELLINGFGVGAVTAGEGIYYASTTGTHAHIVTTMGQFSGGVIVLREGVPAPQVLAGGVNLGAWPDGSMGDRIFVFPASDVASAVTIGTPLTAFGSMQALALPSNIYPLEGTRFATTAFGSPISIHDYAWDHDRDGLEITASTEVAASGAFDGVYDLGGGRLVLSHFGGLLVIGE